MAKRPNGDGNLRRRKDGRYECSIMRGYRDDGRRNIITVYGKMQKEVRDKLKAIQQTFENGINLLLNYTFEQWADIWFNAYKENISLTTQQSYRITLARLKAALGNRPLRSIKTLDIENYLKSLRSEGLSDSYITKTRSMLMKIFTKAEANDLVTKNPVRYADTIRTTAPCDRRDAFSIEEVKAIFKYAPNDLWGHGMRILLGCGLRPQELLALEPRHIAEDGSTITIVQAINMVKGSVRIGPPKTPRSCRVVPVPPNLYDSAKFLRSNCVGQYIYESSKARQPCNPKHFRNQFKKILLNIPGVRTLTPYSCRHSYISLMTSITSLPIAASLVGHLSTSVTEEVYLHVQTAEQIEAAKRFSNAFCA